LHLASWTAGRKGPAGMGESRALSIEVVGTEQVPGEPAAPAVHDFEGDKKDAQPVLVAAFAFIDRPSVKVGISIVVFLNILEMAAATDWPDLEVWIALDHGFLVLYIVEMMLRMGYRGVYLFTGKDRGWSILDASLIILGIIDIWLVAPVFGRHSSMMEDVRLLRLLRAARMFKLLPQLTTFLSALVSMLGGFVWVFLVLFIFLLASAMSLHFMVVEGIVLSSEQLSIEERTLAEERFQSVSNSIFTLFRVVTLDDWTGLIGPLTVGHAWLRVFFVLFIAFASWTLISVLTGIASDEMIAATSNRREEQRLEQERRQKAFIEFLRKSFNDADADGSGTLDKDEFEDLMKAPSMQQAMSDFGLEMTIDELSRAWALLDVDGHGELTIDDFVDGLSVLHETLSVKHIISIDYSVKRTWVRLEKCLDALLQELVQVSRQSEVILKFLMKEEEQQAMLTRHLRDWHAWAALCQPAAVTPKRRDQGSECVRRYSREAVSPLASPRASLPDIMSPNDADHSVRISNKDDLQDEVRQH